MINDILTVYKKELKMYFYSPIAYVVLVVFLLIVGYFQTTDFFSVGYATMDFAFQIIPYVFMFFIPAITMRLIAEEKKTGTLELLVTMPVSDTSIILGKFFASLTLIVVALIFTVLYLIPIVSLLPEESSMDFSPVIGGYLALFLLGAACAAIGLFASSITEDQIIAFIITFLIIFALMFMDRIANFLGSIFGAPLVFLSFKTHMNNISRGVLDLRDIIYFLSIIFVGLLLAVRYLESRKWK